MYYFMPSVLLLIALRSFKGFSVTINNIKFSKVTFAINDCIKTFILCPFLPNGNPVTGDQGLTINRDIYVLIGVIKKNIYSTFNQG